MALPIGTRVALKESALELSYIACRKFYTNMYAGKTGRIIGYTQNGDKLAIEFDDIVFTRLNGIKSNHDNGCHGRGKLQYCWYIPKSCLKILTDNTIELNDLELYWL